VGVEREIDDDLSRGGAPPVEVHGVRLGRGLLSHELAVVPEEEHLALCISGWPPNADDRGDGVASTIADRERSVDHREVCAGVANLNDLPELPPDLGPGRCGKGGGGRGGRPHLRTARQGRASARRGVRGARDSEGQRYRRGPECVA